MPLKRKASSWDQDAFGVQVPHSDVQILGCMIPVHGHHSPSALPAALPQALGFTASTLSASLFCSQLCSSCRPLQHFSFKVLKKLGQWRSDSSLRIFSKNNTIVVACYWKNFFHKKSPNILPKFVHWVLTGSVYALCIFMSSLGPLCILSLSLTPKLMSCFSWLPLLLAIFFFLF